MKKLKAYFESTKGTGILATADSNGKVDAAIYSRPHFLPVLRPFRVSVAHEKGKNVPRLEPGLSSL